MDEAVNQPDETKQPEKKAGWNFKFPKLSLGDKLGIAALLIFVILVSIPVYTDKSSCEVARPAYKCASAKDVIIENCNFWGQFKCEYCKKEEWDKCIDPSLPNIIWYTENLCKIHNKNHPSEKFDCSNIKLVCNQATGNQTCPLTAG